MAKKQTSNPTFQMVPVEKLRENPDNPRVIGATKLKALTKSIKDFPEMLRVRPIVVDDEYMILGGNQRFKASVAAGLKEVPVLMASDFTEEQKAEFVIKDNVEAGEWDWNLLDSEYTRGS